MQQNAKKQAKPTLTRKSFCGQTVQKQEKNVNKKICLTTNADSP